MPISALDPKEGAPREIEIEREIASRSTPRCGKAAAMQAALLARMAAAMHSMVRCRRRWRQQVVMDRGGICWDQSHMVTGRVNEGTFGVGIAVAAIGGQMVVPSFVEVLICDEAGNHMQYTHAISMQSRAFGVHSACNQVHACCTTHPN